MGGQYQAIGHSHFLTNHIDFGMDLQEAIDFPRVLSAPSGKALDVENGVPERVAMTLNRLLPGASPLRERWLHRESGTSARRWP